MTNAKERDVDSDRVICTFYLIEHTRLTVTFDPIIRVLADWFAVALCQQSGNSLDNLITNPTTQLTLNNFVFDHYAFNDLSPFRLYTGCFRDMLVCNHCRFSHLTANRVFTGTENAEAIMYVHVRMFRMFGIFGCDMFRRGQGLIFNNCSFENISIAMSTQSVITESVSFIDLENICSFTGDDDAFLLLMNHSSVRGISSLHSFVSANEFNNLMNYNFVFQIEDTIFDSISTSSAIISLNIWNNDASVVNSVFSNIELGAIYVSYEPIHIVFENTSISTSQLLDDMEDSTEILVDDILYRGLLIVTADSSLIINDMVFTVAYAASIQRNCVANTPTEVLTMFLQTYGLGLIQMDCKNVVGLVHSTGEVTIRGLNVFTDVNETTADEFKTWLLYSPDSTYYGFSFWTWFFSIYIELIYEDFEYDYSTLINSAGTLDARSISVHGVGSHAQFLRNSGTASISNLNTIHDHYCVNSTLCEFDPTVLLYTSWIRHLKVSTCGADMRISGSTFHGAWAYFIYTYGGSLEIHDSQFERGQHGIASSYESETLLVVSSNFTKLGTFYSAGMIGLFGLMMGHWLTPILISTQNATFKDCMFSYYDPHGFVQVNTESHTSFVDCTFAIEFDGILFPASATAHIGLYGMFTPETTGLIMANERSSVSFINNQFAGNSYAPHVPLLYFDNNSSDNCLWGNTLTHYAFHAQQSGVVSCYRPNAMDFFSSESCWNGGFGAFEQMDNQGNVFINNLSQTPIFTLSESSVVLDTTLFQLTNMTNVTHYSIASVFDSNLMILDSSITTDDEILEVDFTMHSDCEVACNRLRNSSSHHISMQQLQVACDVELEWDGDLENVTQSVLSMDPEMTHHGTPTTLRLSTVGGYAPGHFLEVAYEITDANGVVIDDLAVDALTVRLSSANFSFETEFSFANSDNNGSLGLQCVGCGEIYIQSIRIDDVNRSYLLDATVVDGSLFTNDVLVQVTDCMAGYGVLPGNLAQQCAACVNGFYNVLSGSNECRVCGDNYSGFNCLGRNNVIVKNGYWIGVRDVTQHELVSKLFAWYDDINIVSSRCPSSYCCRQEQGCDFGNSYFFNANNESADRLCAKHRDPNIPLCGGCLSGYSELFGSTQCGLCDRNHFELMLLPLLFGLLITVYALLLEAEEVTSEDKDFDEAYKGDTDKGCCDRIKICCSSCSSFAYTCYVTFIEWIGKELLSIFNVIFFKLIIYFYQSISNIFLYGTINNAVLTGFAELFNLLSNPETLNADTGYCLLQNMTAKMELLLPLTVITTAIFVFSTVWLCCKICASETPTICSYQPNFLKSTLKITLLCIGPILSILFKFLSCGHLGELSIHFYFGDEACYGLTWVVSLSVLCLVICSFLVLLLLVCVGKRRQKSELKEGSWMHPLINCYREECFYWEFVIVLRRLCLSLLTICNIFENDSYSFMALILVLTLYIASQLKFEPFAEQQINSFECLLMVFTMVILCTQRAFIDDDSVSDVDQHFALIVLTVFTLAPLAIFAFLLCHFRRGVKQAQRQKAELPEMPRRTTGSILRRLSPFSGAHQYEMMQSPKLKCTEPEEAVEMGQMDSVGIGEDEDSTEL